MADLGQLVWRSRLWTGDQLLRLANRVMPPFRYRRRDYPDGSCTIWREPY